MMRYRLIRYMLVGLVAMLFAACSEDLYTDDDDFVGEKGYITLRFTMPQATVQETRATEPGDNTLNENTIKFVDLYFFPTGQSNEDAALVEENHAVQLDPSGGNTYLVKVRTGDIILNKLFHSTQNGSCEVYAVANSSQKSHSTSTCLDSLRLRVLRHNFGALLTQGHFIMQSNPETLATVNLTNGAATGTIPMTRVAAKLQIYLNVPDTLHVVNEDRSGSAVWKSDRDRMSIVFNNGLMDYTLNGKDTTHPDSSFYNSIQVDMHEYATITKNTTDYNYSHTPFYSYPFSWKETDTHVPTFVIAVPWSKQNPDGKTYGNPEVTYYQVHPNMLTGQIQSNYFYRMYMKIETVGSSDNTTPVDITPSGYRIQPWGEVKLNTPRDLTGDFYRYTYLVVDPTSVVLNNASTTTLRYSSSSALTKDTKITRVEYNSYETAGQVTHHTLDANEIAAQTTNRYELDYTSTPGQIKFTHNVDDGTYAAKTITLQIVNDDGLTELVTIEQYPAIYMNTFLGDNAFVDGYFSHVKDPTASIGNAIYSDYRAYNSVNYSTNFPNGDASFNYYNSDETDIIVPYGSMVKDLGNTGSSGSSGVIKNNSITEITVTSFNSNNGYYTANGTHYYYQIGDPREDAGYTSYDLQAYLTNQKFISHNWLYGDRYTVTQKSWGTAATKIKKASATKTIIAPQFFVSSGWNSSTSVTFLNAQKRAATYQEAGYSAGRWRLPTEAEIMFITARQREGVIPVLFAMDSSANYWASSGRLYHNGQFYNASTNDKGYMRFVYDTWYWGDKAGAVNSYHPEP